MQELKTNDESLEYYEHFEKHWKLRMTSLILNTNETTKIFHLHTVLRQATNIT